MSVWKAFKWVACTLLSGLGAVFVYILKNQTSEKPSPKLAWVIASMRTHWILSSTAVVLFVVLCASLWLLADRKEALEQLAGSVQLFVPSRGLRPDHLGIVSFKPRYVAHAEAEEARQKLSGTGRLLILGRPTGSKTRLAYNLARESNRHWILRVSPGFLDWKSLNFPRLPLRCKVIWVVDDVDKFLGKSDIGQPYCGFHRNDGAFSSVNVPHCHGLVRSGAPATNKRRAVKCPRTRDVGFSD